MKRIEEGKEEKRCSVRENIDGHKRDRDVRGSWSSSFAREHSERNIDFMVFFFFQSRICP